MIKHALRIRRHKGPGQTFKVCLGDCLNFIRRRCHALMAAIDLHAMQTMVRIIVATRATIRPASMVAR